MIVVADTSPLNYLVLIGAVGVVEPLYRRILMPESVVGELQNPATPSAVRDRIAQPPPWCEICPDPPPDLSLQFLDAGERAAIALAVSIHAQRLLIDDWDGRCEAERRQLAVTGTLGVLAQARLRGLFKFEDALAQLRNTNFYCSAKLIERLRQGLIAAERKR